MRSRTTLATLAALAVVVTSCGSDSGTSGSASEEQSSADSTVSIEDAADVTIDPAVDEPFPGAVADDTITVLGQWAIDQATDDLIGDVPEDQEAVFERFAALIPAENRPEVKLFVAIDQEESDGTDGAMQTDPDDLTFYYIALDTTGSSEELDRTMIHEFGHLLSIGQQATLADSCDESQIIVTEVGCLDSGDYLFDFIEEFHPDATTDDAELEYTDEDEYVTDYAATNPSEDLAEVFAEWVLAEEIADGDTITDQKLRFFENYPAAVELREAIRSAL